MMFKKKSETYMYLEGGKRWVNNNLVLVLFKHYWLNRFLHKVTYVKVIYKHTKMYKGNHQMIESNTSTYKESDT